MGKKKAAKKETKSEFPPKVLGKNPSLGADQVNRRWARAGHPGQISNPLYYKIRSDLGIKTVWVWAREPEPAPKSTGELYQFKITLLDYDPPIWRRIQVRDCTLDKLHEHIQTAMGWTNSHLHHFRIDGTYYGDPMLVLGDDVELEYRDSTTTFLSEILPQSSRGFRIEYEYDFGDS